MKNLISTLLIAGSITLGAAQLPMLSPAPRIDGKKGDAGWKKALTASFKIKKGTLRLGRTATHLYVSVDVVHGNSKAYTNNQTKHDSPVYNDDSLDLFFTPDPGAESYYQIIANVRGVLYDHIRDRNGNARMQWDSGAVAKGSYGKNSYYIEMAVPFSALNCHKKVLAIGVAAFTPWNRQGEMLLGTYHKPETFTLFDIPEEFPVKLKNSRWAYAGGNQSSTFLLENTSKKDLHLKGSFNKAPVSIRIKANSTASLECRSYLPAGIEGRNTLILRDNKRELLRLTRVFTPIKLLNVLPESDIIFENEPLRLKISVNERQTENVVVEYFPEKAVCSYKGETVEVPYQKIPSPWK